MKINKIACRCILACMFAFLMIQIYYLSESVLPLSEGKSWRNLVCLFLIQSVCFAVCIFAVFAVWIAERMKKDRTSPFEALLLVTAEGKLKKEILLWDQQSFLVAGAKNGKDIFIETVHDPDSDRHLYGVCNLVGGSWYLEVLSQSRPIGIKRGPDNVIYRLREGNLYKLTAADVIYADTCKIIIKEKGLTNRID